MAPGTYLVNETNTTRYSFMDGIFDSTKFDDDIDTVVLNNSFSGNFTSQIFDANAIVSWNNISWVSNAIGELPNNRQLEDKSYGVDMADNEVLYHFNNQSEYNENETYLHDFSGSGHYGNVPDGKTAGYIPNGKLDGGVEFDGTSESDHRIFIKDGMTDFWDDAGNWSVVMWIYARATSGNIIGKRNDCTPWIWIGNNYRIGFSSYYGVSPAYVENVIVNKAVNLTGENKNNTIIDGGNSGDVVVISTDEVNISRFTIKNGGNFPMPAGIYISSNVKIFLSINMIYG